MIHLVKCLDILTLKVLSKNYFLYNSNKHDIISLILKLAKIKLSLTFEFEIKILRKGQFSGIFLHFSRRDQACPPSFHSLLLQRFLLMVRLKLQMKGRLLSNVSSKKSEENICSNLTYFFKFEIFQTLKVTKSNYSSNFSLF